jgi:hypothetical protein
MGRLFLMQIFFYIIKILFSLPGYFFEETSDMRIFYVVKNDSG